MATMFFSFRILLCLSVFLPLWSFGFDCPGLISPPQGFTFARIESNISGRAGEVYEKIRIKLHYDPTIKDKPYKRLVQEAADFWAKVISVKPVNGRIFKSRDCESIDTTVYKDLDGSGVKEKHCLVSCATVTKCLDIEVRKEHLDGCQYCNQEGKQCHQDEPEPGTGVENADIVFYVSAINTKTCSSEKPVAYAGFCDIEPVLDRPVFASINICPTTSRTDDRKTMLWTMKHEMMHALGFGGRLFKLFRDKEGKPLWPRNQDGLPMNLTTVYEEQKVLRFFNREWHVRGEVIQRHLLYLVTPKVVEEARAFFECDQLEGAEIEDHPKGGSHLEARVFYDDGMKPNLDGGKGLFSRLDFAVLEDSGWYQVDYSQADEMDFGRNLGCNFSMKSCKFWMDKRRKEGKRVDPYCDSPDLEERRGITCIGTKKLFSGCPLAKVPPRVLSIMRDPKSREPPDQIPRKYQHFDKITGVDDNEVHEFGSFDGYAEYCPVPFQNSDKRIIVGDDLDCQKDPNGTLKPQEPIPTTRPLESIPSMKPKEPIPTGKPLEPTSFEPGKPITSGKPLQPIPSFEPSETITSGKPLEPISPIEPSEPIPTVEPLDPEPAKEAMDDKDETDHSSHLCSSALMVFLFLLLIIVL